MDKEYMGSPSNTNNCRSFIMFFTCLWAKKKGKTSFKFSKFKNNLLQKKFNPQIVWTNSQEAIWSSQNITDSLPTGITINNTNSEHLLNVYQVLNTAKCFCFPSSLYLILTTSWDKNYSHCTNKETEPSANVPQGC